jgi:homoserine O-acetyltransferase
MGAAALLAPRTGWAQAAAAERTGVHRTDFAFSSGERRPVRLAYTTIGAPRRNSAGEVVNAALLLHGTGGRGSELLTPAFRKVFLAPGRPLDPSRVFIVAPDSLGHGDSSRPSTDPAPFPAYGYRDMVRGQRLVAEHLGIRRPRLIFGTSMGGHHAWVWATEHPGVAARHLAVATSPAKFVGRNLLWRELAAKALRDNPAPGGAGAQQAAGIMLQAMASPAALERLLKEPGALAGFTRAAAAGASLTPLDLAYAIEAYRDYDPWPKLGVVRGPVLNLNFADDPLYPPEADLVAEAARRQPSIQRVVIPAAPTTNGHGTIGQPQLWAPAVDAFIRAAFS